MQDFSESASSSLSRILDHIQNRNIGIVSASRGIYPETENNQRSSNLERDIRSAGFGFVKMKGHYIEGFGTETPSEPAKESVFFVIGEKGDDNGKLKGVLKNLGNKYDQETVLFKKFDDPNAVLLGTTSKNEKGEPVWPGLGEEVNVGTFHPEKIGTFYTRMKSGRKFVFESIEPNKSWFQSFAEYVKNKT